MKRITIWVVSYNDEVVVAFKKKPTQKALAAYFEIDNEEFIDGSPIDDMRIERTTLIG